MNSVGRACVSVSYLSPMANFDTTRAVSISMGKLIECYSWNYYNEAMSLCLVPIVHIYQKQVGRSEECLEVDMSFVFVSKV